MNLTLSLPWPDKRLSPNARQHYRSKALAVKGARELAYFTTRQQVQTSLFDPADSVTVEYTFYPPDHHKRDLDNCLSSNKAYQDGVFDALGLNDNQIIAIHLSWGAVCDGGQVMMKINQTEIVRGV